MMQSVICAGGRQGLERSEGPGARTFQSRQERFNTACKAPHRQLCDAAADPVAGASW